MRKSTLLIVCILLFTTFTVIFPVQITVANEPPYPPSNPTPENQSTNVPLNIDLTLNLTWDGGDPDGDPVTYDLYFGKESNPPLERENIIDEFYVMGSLSYETTYFWKIIATDNQSASTEGEIWTFTTKKEDQYTLTLTTSGTGNGTVQANATGPFFLGEHVQIWANASTGSTFTGFSGDLTGTTSPQTLTMDENKTVDAEFTLQTGFTLQLTKSGTGEGNIEANRTSPFSYGDTVRIWANASAGSTFTGFSGALSGTTTPQDLTIQGNTTVDAQFTVTEGFTLTLTTSGTGSGSLQANQSAPYANGTVVLIWANASTGSTFTGFSGGLTGTTSPQSLTMDGNKTVDAQFTLQGGFLLTLSTAGAGIGTIQSNASGPFLYGTPVKIWANASTGSTFSGFSGALSGKTTPQTLSMTGNKTVTATFGISGGGGGGGGGQEPPEEPNKKPIADASAGEPYQGFVNSIVRFNGSRSYDLDGFIVEWRWMFGDDTDAATGRIVDHSYAQAKTYTVVLTVTDDAGATHSTMTTCTIRQQNRPPTTPTINGPTQGTKNTSHTYIFSSSDPDNDYLQYTIDWGDGTNHTSGFLTNATGYSLPYQWTAAGRYQLTVTVTDNQTESSATILVYIDAIQTRGAGYLLDTDGDGLYDAFYSDETFQLLPVQRDGASYLIDKDGDGTWDYVYEEALGLTSYQPPRETPGFEVLIVGGAVSIMLVLSRKRRTTNR